MTKAFSPVVTETLGKLLAAPAFQKAMAYLKDDEENRFEELKSIVTVSGAPFTEHLKRSPLYKSLLEKYGATDCVVDKEGNVLGYLRGSGSVRPKILVEGHLDTVFAEDTPLKVTEKDGRFYCPGIGDDTAALACNLSILRAIEHAGLKPVGTLVFGGTVGEEGEGNARGIRALMREHQDIDAVISVESHDAGYICLQGIGIRRYQFEFSAPGGHSWKDFGNPNAIHAMGRAIAKIADLTPPQSPRTSFSVGIVNGGTTVNSLPHTASMKIDMRSVDPTELTRLASTVQSLVEEAVAEENLKWRAAQRVDRSLKVIGDKPAGSLPEDSITAQITMAAAEAIAVPITIAGPSSTNQNIPVNMGIPAVVVGSGGSFAGVHTLEESYSPVGSFKGAQTILLMLFALAGLSGVTEPLAQPCLKRGPVM